MHNKNNSIKSNSYNRQRGFALLLILLVLGSGALYGLLRTLNQNNVQVERDKKTTEVLALAKQALVGHAVSMRLLPPDADRPGDLPCPAQTQSGFATIPCGDSSGGDQDKRLGLLPWKTLKLPELRDGYGELLWYAVSNNFKKNGRKLPLNSDTNGTITVRDSIGNIIYDGRNMTGAVAVIIAPGPAVSRLTSGLQIRTGATVAATNYLDKTISEDNANFIDGSDDGFIQGNVFENTGNLILNDRISVITYEEIMPLIEKRVVAEARYCLSEYAANNGGRYPWAAQIDSLSDKANTYFGRMPVEKFSATKASHVSMSDEWMIGCAAYAKTPGSTAWWKNNKWGDYIFYAIAPDFSPVGNGTPACGNCLTVNSASPQGNKQFVVLSTGRVLPSQFRDSPQQKADFSNYLEGENLSINGIYSHGLISNIFNDQLAFHPK